MSEDKPAFPTRAAAEAEIDQLQQSIIAAEAQIEAWERYLALCGPTPESTACSAGTVPLSAVAKVRKPYTRRGPQKEGSLAAAQAERAQLMASVLQTSATPLSVDEIMQRMKRAHDYPIGTNKPARAKVRKQLTHILDDRDAFEKIEGSTRREHKWKLADVVQPAIVPSTTRQRASDVAAS